MSTPVPDGWLDLSWLTAAEGAEEGPEAAGTPEHKADDVACRVLFAAMDAAQHVIGHGEDVRDQVLALASIHAQVAARAYAAHAIADAIREAVPEIAGAISELGTDIGAGLADGLQSFDSSPRTAG